MSLYYFYVFVLYYTYLKSFTDSRSTSNNSHSILTKACMNVDVPYLDSIITKYVFKKEQYV